MKISQSDERVIYRAILEDQILPRLFCGFLELVAVAGVSMIQLLADDLDEIQWWPICQPVSGMEKFTWIGGRRSPFSRMKTCLSDMRYKKYDRTLYDQRSRIAYGFFAFCPN
jgi:hypothetical protein